MGKPCPDCIIDDVGRAFGMGVIGGSAQHFLNGMHNSPNGTRLLGGAQMVRMNVPRIGGFYAAFAGVYSAMDCTLVHIRQKEDLWNYIIAGAATGGLLSIRQGAAAASRSAVTTGVVITMIIAINKFQNMDTASSSSSSSWFGGLFGKKNDEVKKSSESITKVLESFDAPPVPSYDYK